MKLPRLVLALVPVALAAPLAADGLDITQELVERLGERALRAVEAELGCELRDEVRVRIAAREDAEAALNIELVPQFALQFTDPEVAETNRKLFAKTYASALLGKYSWGERELLVVAENFDELSETLGKPELDSEEALYAVLVHEAVHAAQDLVHGFPETLNGCESVDALLAFNAVIEGHAQFVTRRACTEDADLRGFETFTSCIGAVPETASEAEKLQMRAASAQVVSAYLDGERFIAALAERGGTEAVERAFREPPTTVDVIFHPDWFLDPDSRPAERFNLSRAFNVLVERFEEKEFQHVEQSILRPQLEAGMSLLPAEDVTTGLSGFRSALAHVVADADTPGSSLIPTLVELDEAGAAARFLDLQERILYRKDELMKEGAVRIVSAEYREVELDGLRGLVAAKKIEAPGTSLDTLTFVMSRGPLTVEINAINFPIDEDELVALGAELLERALFAPWKDDSAGGD